MESQETIAFLGCLNKFIMCIQLHIAFLILKINVLKSYCGIMNTYATIYKNSIVQIQVELLTM